MSTPSKRVSTLLSRQDLNDYILPSQTCIAPSSSEIKFRDKSAKEISKVSISLKDCLACSGCITTTELAFVEQQTTEKFLKIIQDRSRSQVFTASLSPQTIASLAAKYSLSWSSMAGKLCFFFKSILQIQKVYDQRISTAIACSLTLTEFISDHCDKDINYERSNDHRPLSIKDEQDIYSDDTGIKKRKTIICSQCPAIVSYIEKNHPSLVNSLSKVKTSQQILGVLIKQTLGNHYYHLSVVPCYDKKLESFREENHIDYVITTVELEMLCKEYHFDLSSTCTTDTMPFDDFSSAIQYANGHSSLLDLKANSEIDIDIGTGGFITVLLSYLSTQGYIIKKTTKSKDLIEWKVWKDGETPRFLSSCYGFKNIQNVVRKLSKGVVETLPCYIEMMACPSACLNGGGQVTTFQESVESYSSNTYSLLKYCWKNTIPTIFQATFKVVDNSSKRPAWALVQW